MGFLSNVQNNNHSNNILTIPYRLVLFLSRTLSSDTSLGSVEQAGHLVFPLPRHDPSRRFIIILSRVALR